MTPDKQPQSSEKEPMFNSPIITHAKAQLAYKKAHDGDNDRVASIENFPLSIEFTESLTSGMVTILNNSEGMISQVEFVFNDLAKMDIGALIQCRDLDPNFFIDNYIYDKEGKLICDDDFQALLYPELVVNIVETYRFLAIVFRKRGYPEAEYFMHMMATSHCRIFEENYVKKRDDPKLRDVVDQIKSGADFNRMDNLETWLVEKYYG